MMMVTINNWLWNLDCVCVYCKSRLNKKHFHFATKSSAHNNNKMFVRAAVSVHFVTFVNVCAGESLIFLSTLRWPGDIKSRTSFKILHVAEQMIRCRLLSSLRGITANYVVLPPQVWFERKTNSRAISRHILAMAELHNRVIIVSLKNKLLKHLKLK